MRTVSWVFPGRFVVALLLALGGQALAAGWKEEVGLMLTQPWVSTALIVVGMTALAASIITLGAGVAEMITFVSLTLFFVGRFLAGQEMWIPLAFFAGGLICLAIEVFVMPGVGVMGAMGVLSLGAAVTLCYEDWQTGLTAFLASMVFSVVGTMLLIKFLPKNRLLRKALVLEPPKPSEKAAKVVAPAVEAGSVGVCASPLRPGGIVDFNGQRVDVVTEGGFVAKDSYVEVVEVQGNKVVVRATPGQQ